MHIEETLNVGLR